MAAVFLLAFLAIIAPIGLAILIARHQSFSAERERGALLAHDVVGRTDVARQQILHALMSVEARPAPAPCSTESIRRLATTVLESEQLQGAGFVRGDRLICTVAGLQQPPTPVGPTEFRTVAGYGLRTHVRLPFAPRTPLIVVSAPSGYAFFIHPKLSLDLPLQNSREAIGIIAMTQRRMINQRGPIDVAMLEPFFRTGVQTYVFKDRLVSAQRSKVGDYAGFAILPMDEVNAGAQRYLIFVLPAGLICGGALILLLRALVRSERSFATIARRALKSGEFHLEYQPLVELATGRWIGAEALVRWRRATGEELRPDLFIPFFEQSGLIPLLTEKVFELVAADTAASPIPLEDFYISINVAASDLRGDRLLTLIDRLLEKTGWEGKQVAIEATERGLIDAGDGSTMLDAARRRGVRVALDDFGTGYSSLAYLQTFPLDTIKIDKRFVDSIAAEAATSSVVGHIINMARDLGLGLIAEGVETEQQVRFLTERGVRHGQGWLFARAMAWDQLVTGLKSRGEGP